MVAEGRLGTKGTLASWSSNLFLPSELQPVTHKWVEFEETKTKHACKSSCQTWLEERQSSSCFTPALYERKSVLGCCCMPQKLQQWPMVFSIERAQKMPWKYINYTKEINRNREEWGRLMMVGGEKQSEAEIKAKKWNDALLGKWHTRSIVFQILIELYEH